MAPQSTLPGYQLLMIQASARWLTQYLSLDVYYLSVRFSCSRDHISYGRELVRAETYRATFHHQPVQLVELTDNSLPLFHGR